MTPCGSVTVQCFKAHARIARRRNGEPSVAQGSRLHTVTAARVVWWSWFRSAPTRRSVPSPRHLSPPHSVESLTASSECAGQGHLTRESVTFPMMRLRLLVGGSAPNLASSSIIIALNPRHTRSRRRGRSHCRDRARQSDGARKTPPRGRTDRWRAGRSTPTSRHPGPG